MFDVLDRGGVVSLDQDHGAAAAFRREMVFAMARRADDVIVLVKAAGNDVLRRLLYPGLLDCGYVDA